MGVLTITPQSQVKDRVGTAILPGATEVLDRETGELVACNKFICPYGINGINHAPYAALIGWTAGVNTTSDPKTQDAAYAFISYVSQPAQANIDVTQGETGFNPYRISQLTDANTWIEAGMSSTAANKYLGGIGASL
ncbi:MAG: ABC transporter substrate-binding protein, partial [Cyanobacteria bacterium J06642_11]